MIKDMPFQLQNQNKQMQKESKLQRMQRKKPYHLENVSQAIPQ